MIGIADAGICSREDHIVPVFIDLHQGSSRLIELISARHEHLMMLPGMLGDNPLLVISL